MSCARSTTPSTELANELLEDVGYVHSGLPDGQPANIDPAAGPIDVQKGSLLDWSPEIRNLVDHHAVMPYLEELIQPGFRLDHSYGIFMRTGWREQVAYSLHNGATPYDPSQSYTFQDGKIQRPHRRELRAH